MKKLILDEIRVESFSTSEATAERGTVQAHGTVLFCSNAQTCNGNPSCHHGTCDPGSCTYSRGEATCEWTCNDNYGCASVDPRCTYGGVYLC